MSGLNICWNMLRVKKCKLKQWKLRTHHHLFHHLLAINVSTHYYLSHAWWAVFSVFPNKYVSSGCDIFAIINLFSSTLISCAQDDSSVGSHFLSAFWKDDRGMNAPMLPLFPPPHRLRLAFVTCILLTASMPGIFDPFRVVPSTLKDLCII